MRWWDLTALNWNATRIQTTPNQQLLLLLGCFHMISSIILSVFFWCLRWATVLVLLSPISPHCMWLLCCSFWGALCRWDEALYDARKAVTMNRDYAKVDPNDLCLKNRWALCGSTWGHVNCLAYEFWLHTIVWTSQYAAYLMVASNRQEWCSVCFCCTFWLSNTFSIWVLLLMK